MWDVLVNQHKCNINMNNGWFELEVNEWRLVKGIWKICNTPFCILWFRWVRVKKRKRKLGASEKWWVEERRVWRFSVGFSLGSHGLPWLALGSSFKAFRSLSHTHCLFSLGCWLVLTTFCLQIVCCGSLSFSFIMCLTRVTCLLHICIFPFPRSDLFLLITKI